MKKEKNNSQKHFIGRKNTIAKATTASISNQKETRQERMGAIEREAKRVEKKTAVPDRIAKRTTLYKTKRENTKRENKMAHQVCVNDEWAKKKS